VAVVTPWVTLLVNSLTDERVGLRLSEHLFN
jgi:hypothetical protein